MTVSRIKQVTEKVFGKQPFNIGDIVFHPKDGRVKIVSGEYWGEHGFSNFWCWRKVNDDGSLDATVTCGYGWVRGKQ